MSRRLILVLSSIILCAGSLFGQCSFTNTLSCPAALQVGQLGTCTLTSRNTGSTACSGFLFSGMMGFDDTGNQERVRFTNTQSGLLLCFDSSGFPTVPGASFPYTYCFSEGATVPPNGTLTTSASIEVITEPPSGILHVYGFASALDAEYEVVSESEPAIATIAVGPGGCNTPRTATVFAPSVAASNILYPVSWLQLAGVSNYDIQESTNPDFNGATTQRVTSTVATFTHNVTASTSYYYRVRGIADCNQSLGAFSTTARTVVEPLPAATDADFDLSRAIGSVEPIVFQIFVKSPEAAAKQGLDVGFTATTNKSWVTVTPPSGTLTPAGTTLTVTADPKTLPPGASTGNVVVTNTTTGAPIQNTPVTVNLVSPVTQTGKAEPPPTALILPVVAKVDSANSRFQSDVRLSNISSQPITFRLAFTPSGQDGRQTGSQTSFQIDPAQTVALNDVLKNSFGVGALSGEVASGSLEIRPLNEINIGLPGQQPGAQEQSLIASSRTYAITSNGTLGQFIPAIPFSEFAGIGHTLSVQQIAQSTDYRTNVGFVEGSGADASLQIRIVGPTGQSLCQSTVNLKPFEHRQMSLRQLNGCETVSLTDGRMEVLVSSPTGKITAYASVLDNLTDDPLLVSPVEPATISESRYIIPGVADLNNGIASWRTDIRIYNASTSPIQTTLTYYKSEPPPAPPRTTQITIAPGEVRAIDNTLQTLYGMSGSGGAIVVTTPNPAAFVVTARTYNQTANGTYGQFIPAVTPSEGTGVGDRPLQLLQVEQSPAFRSNIGLFELTGNPATAHVEVYVPETKTAFTRDFTLQPNEFTQFPLDSIPGLGSGTYNARVSLSVTGGAGRVSGYASVIDAKTQDPTYVPAQ